MSDSEQLSAIRFGCALGFSFVILLLTVIWVSVVEISKRLPK